MNNYYNNFAPTTNKIYVTSEEDALNRYASPNSVMIYVLQDETKLFDVYTDAFGRKTIKTRNVIEVVPTEDVKANNYIERKEFDEFKNEIKKLLKGGSKNE